MNPRRGQDGVKLVCPDCRANAQGLNGLQWLQVAQRARSRLLTTPENSVTPSTGGMLELAPSGTPTGSMHSASPEAGGLPEGPALLRGHTVPVAALLDALREENQKQDAVVGAAGPQVCPAVDEGFPVVSFTFRKSEWLCRSSGVPCTEPLLHRASAAGSWQHSRQLCSCQGIWTVDHQWTPPVVVAASGQGIAHACALPCSGMSWRYGRSGLGSLPMCKWKLWGKRYLMSVSILTHMTPSMKKFN